MGVEMAAKEARDRTWSASAVRETSRRPLRIFAFDPMADRFREPTISRVTYEQLAPGPRGRLVEVFDYDRAENLVWPPIDLDDPDILITQGLAPSESDFRFHQQMVYAVSMRVLEVFERGLGRPISWEGLPRLWLLPHAHRDPNAYFEPTQFALMFGSFLAHQEDPGHNLAGQQVFTCLSYDVIAHEICHPVMWRMRPWEHDDLSDVADTLAFHEGMADLIAMLARFDEPDVVARTVSEQGNDLVGSELLQIAMQFGQAADIGVALRVFPDTPDPERYTTETEPHARGQLLTSAIVQAFVLALHEQTADLVRLSGSTGDFRHPDLVRRLAAEASTLAASVLRVAVCAMDYLPPVGVRFFDVLRAMLTSDIMLFGRAHRRFRALLVDAFHSRGLIPSEAGSLAVDALVLKPVLHPIPEALPYAADALLHTVQALEWRRLHMVGTTMLDQTRTALLDDQEARRTTWIPAIERFARKHAETLGLATGTAVHAHNVVGANQIDSGGNLVARIVVTLVQHGSRSRPARGVTLVCDSEGTVQFVIGDIPAETERRRVPVALTAAQRDLIAAVRGAN
jgi:hypothetical protein